MVASRQLRRAVVLCLALVAALLVPVAPGSAQVPVPDTVMVSIDGLAAATTEAGDAGEAEPDVDGEVTAAGVGTVVSEPTDTVAYNMVALRVPDGIDHLEVRGRGDDGWSDWFEVHADVSHGPDPDTSESDGGASGRRPTEPVWMGPADGVQLRVPDGGDPADVEVVLIDSLGLTESLPTKLARYLRASPAPAEASVVAPFSYVSRAQWGADERLRGGEPDVAADVNLGVVHHTAGGNGYAPSQGPAVVRGIYAFHTRAQSAGGNGWDDIGYNLLVDRYGVVYEGRYGGLERGVVGAHAYGWNTGSFGVASLGEHNDAPPTDAMLSSLAQVFAWKFLLHGIDPSPEARTTHAGQTVPTVLGHRNVRGNFTADPGPTNDCPGSLLYARLPELRQRIAAAADEVVVPVTGDWDGDGIDTPGVFVGGRWMLRDANTAGAPDVTFRYGRTGDIPLVGDWNGDGRDTVGIVRDGAWHLRDRLAGGRADRTFTFGRTRDGDIPLIGDWDGDGRDTVGIVRRGEWHLRDALAGGNADRTFVYGRVLDGDVPVIGDWDGDGTVGVGIVRSGRWHLRNSLTAGFADVQVPFGRAAGDVPIVGDWNRDGATTVGVVRGDRWLLRNHNSGGNASRDFRY